MLHGMVKGVLKIEIYVKRIRVLVVKDMNYHDEQYGDIIITVRNREVVM